jgi:hypothetical protein
VNILHVAHRDRNHLHRQYPFTLHAHPAQQCGDHGRRQPVLLGEARPPQHSRVLSEDRIGDQQAEGALPPLGDEPMW